jgi:glutamate formiminotransferase/glutamate formiminotransferase/formiminotetrahydrofolate cyclodeaminase
VAKSIARTIRESSGGLPCVKALGLSLESKGLTQVSMNLTDFTVTPVDAVFDRVVEEAARLGVEIFESELVGLAPAAALGNDPARRLKLRGFRPGMLLEHRLREVLGES